MTGEDKTHFAPAERSAGTKLDKEARKISRNPVVEAILAASAGLLAVLNEHRQVVAVNQRMLNELGVKNPGELLGLRLGEAVDCTHASDNPAGGCGTGRMCASCGAAVATVTSLVEDRTVERTCSIEVERQGVVDDLFLSVRAHPIVWEKSRWVLLFLHDISTQQQWTMLERVFLHDISNAVFAVQGSCTGLEEEVPAALKEQAHVLEHYSGKLAREVSLHRMLLNAQENLVELKPVPVGLEAVLTDLDEMFKHHPSGRNKRVRFDDRTAGLSIMTDPVVLNRVLGNMVINALEATDESGEVQVWCEEAAGQVVFCVSNLGEMPVEVAGRIFQRNFSTKGGLGRGLGTYSMKLFGEKILGGELDFFSPGTGQTVFAFRLPIDKD